MKRLLVFVLMFIMVSGFIANVSYGIDDSKTLKVDPGFVYSVAFSPDGKILASGSDGNIILWDVAAGSKIKTLKGHSRDVSSVSFSPDGKILASGNLDSSVILWDIATGDKIKTLAGHSSYVSSVAFSPDGNILASGSDDNIVVFWKIGTGKMLKSIKNHYKVSSVTFSPDGKILAYGNGKEAILLDVDTGNIIKTIDGRYDLKSVAFNPDGKILATIGYDSIILQIWQTALDYAKERKERIEKEKKEKEEGEERETERFRSYLEKQRKAENEREKLYKSFGLSGKLEKDLPKVARQFRNGMIKARDWKYRIEHNTTSDKIESENNKMLKWFREEVTPLGTILIDLANQYRTRYGDEGLRDFAIKNNFLDVLENRY